MPLPRQRSAALAEPLPGPRSHRRSLARGVRDGAPCGAPWRIRQPAAACARGWAAAARSRQPSRSTLPQRRTARRRRCDCRCMTRRARCAAQQSRTHALAAADAPGLCIAPPCAPRRPRSPRTAATASRPARGHCTAAGSRVRGLRSGCADAARAPAQRLQRLCAAQRRHLLRLPGRARRGRRRRDAHRQQDAAAPADALHAFAPCLQTRFGCWARCRSATARSLTRWPSTRCLAPPSCCGRVHSCQCLALELPDGAYRARGRRRRCCSSTAAPRWTRCAKRWTP